MDYIEELEETENTPGFKLFFSLVGGLFVLFLGLSATLLTTTDQPQTDQLESYTLLETEPVKADF